MDHHIDIDVRPDPEFPAHQLMGALYAKLHRALVARNSNCIGVSFPGFNSRAPHLGTRLRLHGNLATLSALMASDWITGMRDHVTLIPPTRAPENAKHCVVRRVQVKSSPERLRRRLMRRHDLDVEEAHRRISDEVARLADLPYVQLRSTSSGQSFRLFIEHGPAQSHAVAGNFNAYGLSQVATIPWF
ncbi:type I-F CRISPR-associated endoribonuclease Cas6/Csy4 [Nitrosovibrio tenuis]|uniref:CRISPR-associated protein, Csy4 family n=1 Tax=Nitrosovibrio tenuis TaxID=1233 RepID=A0A1H7GN44_9PROT|nr:type I-F CRISPR-associated endoribonuclease Cas6/Csy4 [Nitrosovibrio tenuis]SEK39489.1 CRISPR-associated protein, Csy4 family [Nitrosovibrio tenuis]